MISGPRTYEEIFADVDISNEESHKSFIDRLTLEELLSIGIEGESVLFRLAYNTIIYKPELFYLAWDKFKDKLTIENLLVQVQKDGEFQGMSALWALATVAFASYKKQHRTVEIFKEALKQLPGRLPPGELGTRPLDGKPLSELFDKLTLTFIERRNDFFNALSEKMHLISLDDKAEAAYKGGFINAHYYLAEYLSQNATHDDLIRIRNYYLKVPEISFYYADAQQKSKPISVKAEHFYQEATQTQGNVRVDHFKQALRCAILCEGQEKKQLLLKIAQGYIGCDKAVTEKHVEQWLAARPANHVEWLLDAFEQIKYTLKLNLDGITEELASVMESLRINDEELTKVTAKCEEEVRLLNLEVERLKTSKAEPQREAIPQDRQTVTAASGHEISPSLTFHYDQSSALAKGKAVNNSAAKGSLKPQRRSWSVSSKTKVM